MIESDILAHHVECVRESIWLEDGGLKSGCRVSNADQNSAAFIARGQSGKACLNRTSRLLLGHPLDQGCNQKPFFSGVIILFDLGHNQSQSFDCC
jgi:hypothetical protein